MVAKKNFSKTIIVTGAAGFIGSQVVRQLVNENYRIIAYDSLTYSGRLENLRALEKSHRYQFVEGSINDAASINAVLNREKPVAVMNLAAETHVDRSIDNPSKFLASNVAGTQVLLQACLEYWRQLSLDLKDEFRFVQISTDEVYGSVDTGAAAETAGYAPNSPYAASKAAADHFVRSYFATYGLPVIITHGGNTYGPRQFPEKLIPRLILRGLSGETLPIYGRGENLREWISVEDHAKGIISAWTQGTPGSSYNLGSEVGLSNLTVAKMICDALRIDPQKAIKFVSDRPGHDTRYAMDCSRARRDLGWTAEDNLKTDLPAVIQWYQDNPDWWCPILTEQYNLSRLGIIEIADS